ncbi:MAG: tetratricopeptide repeat protein [Hyphomicrobiaceae bacterium]|nr:tetratricopeptide repeat protein [Hyphomicrobiaceae bacterium]
MSHPARREVPPRRRTKSAAVPLVLTLATALGGCAGSGLDLPDLASAPAESTTASSGGAIETGSLPPVSAKSDPATTDTADAGASLPPAIAKAREQRAAGDKLAAMETLEAAGKAAPDDRMISRERGLLALELGRIGEARKLLMAADDAKAPDWRLKSALGSAHAASGDQKAAQREFQAALKLAPDHPSILNNLALSYALEGRHGEAERLLRRAATNRADGDRAKQNLALILGLNGNIDEARKLSEASLPKPVAAANVSYLERLRSSGVKVSRVDRDGDDVTAGATTIGALSGQR